jgi:hypothetical protein
MNTVLTLVVILIIVLGLDGTAIADQLDLFTDICPYIFDNNDPNLPINNPYQDSNWDWWQQPGPNEPWDPNVHHDPNVVEDAIYLCAFDGASGHDEHQLDWPTDGNVDGCYSTLYMGPGGGETGRSLGVGGTDPCEFPDNQRDTRVVALFNLSKIKQINTDAGAILNCTLQCSCEKVFDWSRQGQDDLQAPTKLYMSIFPANKQQYWCHPPDDTSHPNTPIGDLQDEFDGDPDAEKDIDIQVDDGPWGPGLQPLTDWYIKEYGAQFYEVDFTEELRQIMDANSNLEWIGLTIRPSLDGEVVYLSLDAQEYLSDNPVPKPIPPTLEVQVSKYLGDLNDEGGVDLVDFALFAQQWGKSGGLRIADLNVNGTVDLADLDLFCENWLKGKSP